jgi:hypothetical protein
MSLELIDRRAEGAGWASSWLTAAAIRRRRW